MSIPHADSFYPEFRIPNFFPDSLLITLLFASLEAIFLHFLIRRKGLFLRIHPLVLMIITGMSFFRFLFPISMSYSHRFYFSGIVLDIYSFICAKRFILPWLHLHLSIWNIAQSIWVLGAAYHFLAEFILHRRLRERILLYSKDVTAQVCSYTSLSEKELQLIRSRHICVLETPSLYSPQTFGLHHPLILIPKMCAVR